MSAMVEVRTLHQELLVLLGEPCYTTTTTVLPQQPLELPTGIAALQAGEGVIDTQLDVAWTVMRDAQSWEMPWQGQVLLTQQQHHHQHDSFGSAALTSSVGSSLMTAEPSLADALGTRDDVAASLAMLHTSSAAFPTAGVSSQSSLLPGYSLLSDGGAAMPAGPHVSPFTTAGLSMATETELAAALGGLGMAGSNSNALDACSSLQLPGCSVVAHVGLQDLLMQPQNRQAGSGSLQQAYSRGPVQFGMAAAGFTHNNSSPQLYVAVQDVSAFSNSGWAAGQQLMEKPCRHSIHVVSHSLLAQGGVPAAALTPAAAWHHSSSGLPPAHQLPPSGAGMAAQRPSLEFASAGSHGASGSGAGDQACRGQQAGPNRRRSMDAAAWRRSSLEAGAGMVPSAAPRWAGAGWQPLADVLKSGQPAVKGTGVFLPGISVAAPSPAVAAAADGSEGGRFSELLRPAHTHMHV